MSNIVDIFPANDFRVVADSAVKELEVGLIIGYDVNGGLCVFGGGIINGKQPVNKDWLWLLETVRDDLLHGEYDNDST